MPMTLKIAQLLLALEPHKEYTVWEAARRAGIRSAAGVAMRLNDLLKRRRTDLFRTAYEEGTRYITRIYPGHCLVDMEPPTKLKWGSAGVFEMPPTCWNALTQIENCVVALGKEFPCGFVHLPSRPQVFPASDWSRVSRVTMRKLLKAGLLMKIDEDDLAIFFTLNKRGAALAATR